MNLQRQNLRGICSSSMKSEFWNYTARIEFDCALHTFQEHLAKEFFEGTFDDHSAMFRLVTGALSPASIQILMTRLRQVAEEVATLHVKDQRLPREYKSNVTCVLTLRDWEPLVFQSLQRK
jgi:hypothetical protein